MTLPFERLAFFSLGAMLTTLLVTNAPSDTPRPVADAPALPAHRCDELPITVETNEIIRAAIEGARFH